MRAVAWAVGGVVAVAAAWALLSRAPQKTSPKLSAVAEAVRANREARLAAIRALRCEGALATKECSRRKRRAALFAAFPDASAFADAYSSRNDGQVNGGAVDEFGRYYKGGPWDPVGFAVSVYEQTAPFLPLPPHVRAAVAVAIAIGRGRSLKSAALEAARNSLPPTARLGFDIGLGIASGEPVDDVALDAVWAQHPEAVAGYKLAVKVSQ